MRPKHEMDKENVRNEKKPTNDFESGQFGQVNSFAHRELSVLVLYMLGKVASIW